MKKLLTILGEIPRFCDAETCSLPGWTDSGLGDWLGFYDILRNASNRPIGLRFWPFEEAFKALSKITPSAQMRVEDGGAALCLLFGVVDQWSEGKSGDQLMEEARLLTGPNNEVALLVGLSVLAQKDLLELEREIAKSNDSPPAGPCG